MVWVWGGALFKYPTNGREGSVGETCLKTFIIFAVSFSDASGEKLYTSEKKHKWPQSN